MACFAQTLKLIVHDFLGKHWAIKATSSEEQEKCHALFLFNHQKSKPLATLLPLQLITPSSELAEAKRLAPYQIRLEI